MNLTVGDIQDGHITVQRLKRSLKTTQPLLASDDPLLNEKAALGEFIRNQTSESRIFPRSRFTFWRVMQRHCAAAGIPKHKAHPHALKHSIAMQIIGIAGIENTRQYLGHRSLDSTGEYLVTSDEAASEAAARALRAL